MDYNEPFDAVIQAGFGEHGREELQELVNVPVIDVTEAAAHLAMMLGYRFSIVTTLQRTVPQILDRLRVAGMLEHCASVRATGLSVLELAEDPARTCRVVVDEAMKAIRNDQAEVICLGCGGLAGLDQMVADEAGVPVVDGVGAAVGLAETLVRLGLSTSRSARMPRRCRRHARAGRSSVMALRRDRSNGASAWIDPARWRKAGGGGQASPQPPRGVPK